MAYVSWEVFEDEVPSDIPIIKAPLPAVPGDEVMFAYITHNGQDITISRWLGLRTDGEIWYTSGHIDVKDIVSSWEKVINE